MKEYLSAAGSTVAGIGVITVGISALWVVAVVWWVKAGRKEA